MVTPVNIVAGGDLNTEVDLDAVADELANDESVSAEFTDEHKWQLVIQFKESGTVLLYRTGSYILRGGESHEQLSKTKKAWLRLFEDRGIITDISQVEFEIQNIVFTEDFGEHYDLNKVAILLGLNQTEYEPEQFPGLIYRPEGTGVVMLLFATGKAVLTGCTDQDVVEEFVESVQEELSKF